MQQETLRSTAKLTISRGWLFCLFLLVFTVTLGTLSQASAKVFQFRDISLTADIPDDYIRLTKDNLDLHPEWVESQHTTKEQLIAQWEADGTLLTCWSPQGDVRIIFTAVQDADAAQYFDLDQQTAKVRADFRNRFVKDKILQNDGYTVQSAEWKKTTSAGRFLNIRYKRDSSGTIYRGFMRRTVRNGYTIIVDYQVHGRNRKGTDTTAITSLMNNMSFTSIQTKTAQSVTSVTLESEPPTETNTGFFVVKGTCEPNLHLVGVVMRMSSPNPLRLETTADKKGAFSLKVNLPEEGLWLMTLSVMNGETLVDEKVFNTTTFQKNLLPVNFTETFPENIPSNTTIISGTTSKAVTVQCIVESIGFNKSVRTNGTGKFTFKIPTATEGQYDVVMNFEKKGLSGRRMNFTGTRTIGEGDYKATIREQAIKPAYSNLIKRIEGYTGRIMGYNLYYVQSAAFGDQWVITMGMDKTDKGYKNIVVVLAKEEPDFATGTRLKMYGTLSGTYQLNVDGNEKSYPSFDLLFFD